MSTKCLLAKCFLIKRLSASKGSNSWFKKCWLA
jgi:hypothetical protein